MTRRFVLLLAAFIAAHGAVAAADRTPTPADLQRIETLQRRLDKLAFGGLGASHYGLSKARAWLDFSVDEYHDKDRSGIVQDAAAEAARLIDAIEVDAKFDARATPHPLASEKVRADLWAVADQLKADTACASRALAELEVQLVWTGHEKWESGWDHAAPYSRIAELLAHDAQQAQARCRARTAAAPAPAPAPAPVIAPAPVVAPASVTAPAPAPVAAAPTPASVAPSAAEAEIITLDEGFAFARSNLHKSHAMRKMLDAAARRIKADRASAVEVIGHADHLGRPQRVKARSQERAQWVKTALVARGVPASRITTRGEGASQPRVQCDARQPDAALKACLAPNRRVDILITGAR